MVVKLSKLYRKFKGDERGSFSVILALMFIALLVVGGAGIDLIRYETIRSNVQYNLDRAVLAAASMRQTQNPETIVLDYMNKIDDADDVVFTSLNYDVSLTGRTVDASVEVNVNNFFLRMAGLNSFSAVATSRATERIPNLEISLVLDVSGSMGGTKISTLRTAANTFVDTVIDPDTDATTSVSIVPYSTNVNLPQNMWDLYNTEGTTDLTRCMIFDDDDFDDTAIDMSVEQRQLPYYSYYGIKDVAGGYDAFHCNAQTYAEVMPFSTSVADLQAKITSLQATGSTAAHIGTKWGVALLDPASKPVADSLGTGLVDIPASHTNGDVLKVLVVMTDGENQYHYDIKDGFRTGASDMYEVETLENILSCDNYTSFFEDNPDHYLFDDYNCSYTPTAETNRYIYRTDNDTYYKVGSGASTSTGTAYSDLPGDPDANPGELGYQDRFDWSEDWEYISVDSYGRTIGLNLWHTLQTYSTASDADSEMRDSCDAAKNKGIVVYSIFFKESGDTSDTSNAETLLSDCATSTGTYYKANTADISTVFATIAFSIQKLKLTQ